MYVVNFHDWSEICHVGNWTFGNAFIFMGSMASTIGYGRTVPHVTKNDVFDGIKIILDRPGKNDVHWQQCSFYSAFCIAYLITDLFFFFIRLLVR